MKITTEMVDYISELSRLSLPKREKAAMATQLEQIVAYMDTLNTLDTQGVEPMSHVFPVRNVFREDYVRDSMDRDLLLDNAPQRDSGTFLVPKAVD
jgi:aspartyl-tRNA(Asn)/glutamyl-tRNA(Gln) amidotransferase subunit C